MVDLPPGAKVSQMGLRKINWALREENLIKCFENLESFREGCRFYDLERWKQEKSSLSAILKNRFQEERKINGEGK